MTDTKKQMNEEDAEKVAGGGWFSNLWEKTKDVGTTTTSHVTKMMPPQCPAETAPTVGAAQEGDQ